MEVLMALLVMADAIPIDLLMDMVVIMVLKVDVMVAFQMIHMELVQRGPFPKSLEEDADVTDMPSNMTNLST